MPRKVTHTAWAVYIDPATLATHVEAEVYHHNLIDAIIKNADPRNGEHPLSSKLPCELVLRVNDHLRDLLIVDKQLIEYKIKYRDESCKYTTWKTERCFKGGCFPVDHLPDDQVEALEQHLAKEYEPDSDDFDSVYEITEYLYDTSQQQIARDGIITVDWRAIHNARIHEYEGLVGRPGSGHYGVLTTHQDFLLKHYGLQVWVRFEQHEECSYQAEAYLTLPSDVPMQSSIVPFNFKPCNSGGSKGHHRIGHRCDAETQVDRLLVTPDALDSAQHATFARAMKEMGLRSRSRRLSKKDAVAELKGYGPGCWSRDEYGQRLLNAPAHFRQLSHIYR
ncbi:hypothetical protein LTR17_021919 [Elasticomyces elasticus]|nr:hypothetical protein LTR17_021919 [Elasticomyces elasticus]